MNSIRKEKPNMKAIITRNDQTAVLELPTSRMELAGSLKEAYTDEERSSKQDMVHKII